MQIVLFQAGSSHDGTCVGSIFDLVELVRFETATKEHLCAI